MSTPNPPSTDSSKTTGKPFLKQTPIRIPRMIRRFFPIPTSIHSRIEKIDGRKNHKRTKGLTCEIRSSQRKKPTILREGLAFFFVPTAAETVSVPKESV